MTANKTQRLQSLDVMRGLTVAMMILVNNQYGESFAPLQHAKWNGMTPCDLVFPFFLFIMGISTYLSLMKTGFKPSAPVIRKIVKRTVLLFLIGLGIHWFDMALDGHATDLAHLRIWAVLQRIALCYLAVSVFALTVSHRHLIKTIVGLLVLYALILIFGNGYDYDASTNILARVDLRLFGAGHLYHKSPVDPEGLLGTIPSVAHTLIGLGKGAGIPADGRHPRHLRLPALFWTAAQQAHLESQLCTCHMRTGCPAARNHHVCDGLSEGSAKEEFFLRKPSAFVYNLLPGIRC